MDNNYEELSCNDFNTRVKVTTSVKIRVDKSTLKVGDKLCYTVTAVNSGNNDATDAKVKIQLPGGVKVNGDAVAEGMVEWNIGRLCAGETKYFFLQGEACETGTWIARGCITQCERNTTDNPCTTSTIKVVNSIVDLSTEISMKKTRGKHDGIINSGMLKITVRNSGTDRATGVYALAVLPPEMVRITDNSNGKYDSKSGIWQVGTLECGESKTLFITVGIIKCEKIVMKVFVNSNQQDINYNNNSDTLIVNVKHKK